MKEKYSTQLSVKGGVNKAKINDGMFKLIRDFQVIILAEGQKLKLKSGDSEIALVILKGTCDVNIDGKTYDNLGTRKDIFQEKPTAVYIPIEKEFEIVSRNVEIALCSAVCKEKKDVAVITPDKVKVMQVGKDNWARQVSLVITPDTVSANLIIGETINPPGNWSGTPAHKHEIDDLPNESFHEELYYFKCDRQDGFGVQRLYSLERGVNDLIYLKDNTVTFMPWGYHQIVAGPGYTLYYLFFLSGTGKKLVGCGDPEHTWIAQ